MIFKKHTTSNNPLLGEAGRQTWSDRYGKMASSIRGWQAAFAAAIASSFILTLVVVHLATSARIEAFAVETHQGMPLSITPMQTISLNNTQLITYAMNQFIISARTVVSDKEAQQMLLKRVYAFAADQTLPFLKNYYQKNNPFLESQNHTTSIEIINTLPLSPHTVQVVFEETIRQTLTGQTVEKNRWMANLNYHLSSVDRAHLNDNPFGFYITSLTWSKDQTFLGAQS